MNMDSLDKQRRHRILESFSYAITGIGTAVRAERNMRIHLVMSVIVLGCSVFFSINKSEWLFVILAIGGMFSLELMNTAVERVVDLITEDYHPLAKQAKDLAAAAVFVYAIIAVVIGMIIFLPYILKFFI